MTRDPVKIITALARQFPALRNAPGLDPWKPELLDEWAASGGPSSGARAMVRLFQSPYQRIGFFIPFSRLSSRTFFMSPLRSFARRWASS